MDPFSQLSQLQHNLQAMTKTVAGLENDMLEVLKENTELKVENQLLREKISKLDASWFEVIEKYLRFWLPYLQYVLWFSP